MRLKGSCHYDAVRFQVNSHQPYPFMRCYCTICRKTAGGSGYAINLAGDHRTLEVEGEERITVYHAKIQHPEDERPHTIDLNDRETLSEIGLINPTLDNAVSHDIASEGQAIAEIMDSNLSGTDAQDVCKLLLVSSLSNVPDGVRGLWNRWSRRLQS